MTKGALTCLVIASFGLSGCSDRAPAGNAVAAKAPTAAAVKAAPHAEPPRAGCADGITVALDRPLMAHEDGSAFSEARLNDFQGDVQTAFRAAANALCRKDAEFASSLEPIKLVVTRSGAGADEPTFHVDGQKPGSLIFEWYFADADLDVPKRPDIEQGLRCWADPKRKECSDRGD